jgi:carboxypeptidase Q
MKRCLPLLLTIAAACSRPSAAADSEAKVIALRDAVLATSEAYATVRSLQDEAGPRLSGSPGDAIAVAWAVRAMKAAGLANVRAERVVVPRWERGEERAEIVSPSPQPLVIAALGGSVATPPGGVTGEVVEVPSLDAIDHADPSKITGKIVFVDLPMERTADGSGYGRAVGPRALGAIRAAKKGAVGVVIRSVGTDKSRAPHTGNMRYEEGVPKIPAAALSIPDADAIHRRIAAGERVTIKMTLGARTLPDAESANVVGEVIGTSAPKEIVLLGAHLDSWDLGRGALDDGAGCAIVMEAARQIGKLGPARRTVRVVLFANEENGLKGARAYAAAHASEIPQHVVALEADLGDGRVREARFLGAAASAPLFRAVASAVEPLGARISDEPAHGGADLIPLIDAGVPVLDLRQDATRYFDFHHTANDTIEQVRKVDLDHATAAFATVAYAAAQARGDFGRIPEADRHTD